MPRLLSFVIFATLGLTSAFGQTSRVVALKQFLATPPSIDEIVFKKRQLYQIPYPGAPELNTNTCQIFCAKWQNTDFVIREIKSLKEMDNPDALTNTLVIAYGKNGSTFWKIIGDDYVYWKDTKHAYSTDYVPLENLPHDKDVLIQTCTLRNMLLQVINMGIGDIMPGSLKWDGDSFTAEDQLHAQLIGAITVENGSPKELRYRAKGENGTSFVDFSYQGEKNATLPDKFTYGYINKDKVKTPILEITIVSLQIANSTIPEDEFSANSFRVKGFTKIIQVAGNSLLWKDPQGTTIVIPSKNATKNVPRITVIPFREIANG